MAFSILTFQPLDGPSLITGEKVQFASPTSIVLESIREGCDKAFPDGILSLLSGKYDIFITAAWNGPLCSVS